MAVQLDAADTTLHIETMLLPLVRTVQAQEQRNKAREERAAAGGGRKRSYNDALNVAAGKRMTGDDTRDANTELATEVMELLSKKFGGAIYLPHYATVVARIREAKAARRQERTVMAVRDPAAAAEARQRRNDGKRRSGKRKVDQLRHAHGKVAVKRSKVSSGVWDTGSTPSGE